MPGRSVRLESLHLPFPLRPNGGGFGRARPSGEARAFRGGDGERPPMLPFVGPPLLSKDLQCRSCPAALTFAAFHPSLPSRERVVARIGPPQWRSPWRPLSAWSP